MRGDHDGDGIAGDVHRGDDATEPDRGEQLTATSGTISAAVLTASWVTPMARPRNRLRAKWATAEAEGEPLATGRWTRREQTMRA